MSLYKIGTLVMIEGKVKKIYGPFVIYDLAGELAHLRAFSFIRTGEEEEICEVSSLVELNIDLVNWIGDVTKVFDEEDFKIKSGKVVRLILSDDSPTFQYFENGWIADFKVTVTTDNDESVEGWYFEPDRSIFETGPNRALEKKKIISFSKEL